ncbi:uncharacterized protein P174DRAFT_132866 [Aspergillus novofumigatus IBT 16806]|uniref:Uncharacterized protein n=1 Tax=Aspergillus novofumigatus (strain IBT 16806) TaxID=1392255 RepID=A0A2I1CCU5_ASPN1|nr:uncharacterized protein P174DRAFT_132866 [Aspergillus novofumigatus IBT 16806]PKX95453.1 hypothetical protein P174DRAFT_132866 [Aspergillus novofumigatus IBT 16806]
MRAHVFLLCGSVIVHPPSKRTGQEGLSYCELSTTALTPLAVPNLSTQAAICTRIASFVSLPSPTLRRSHFSYFLTHVYFFYRSAVHCIFISTRLPYYHTAGVRWIFSRGFDVAARTSRAKSTSRPLSDHFCILYPE